MHDRTPDPPFPDARRTGRVEDINDDCTIARADGTGRPIHWQNDREGC